MERCVFFMKELCSDLCFDFDHGYSTRTCNAKRMGLERAQAQNDGRRQLNGEAEPLSCAMRAVPN